MLMKNVYPLIDRVFKTDINRLNYIKPYGPEKCPVLLIATYAGEKSTLVKRNIKKFSKKVYRAAKPRVIFTLSSVLSPIGKDLISNKHKSCVVYTFECCCSNNYISQTSRHLEIRIKEHTSKCVSDHISNQSKTIIIATSNAMNRSSISEHLTKNPI